MTGRRKAAILLLILGKDAASEILKHIDPSLHEEISLEIATIERVSPEEREGVIREFYEMVRAREYILRGGVEFAQEMLSKALGPEEAKRIVKKLTQSLRARPFDFFRKTDPDRIYTFIAHEHPQVIALLLTYLRSEQASAILEMLPPEKQVEVAERIAKLERASPDIVQKLEKTLEARIQSFSVQEVATSGGIQTVVDILNESSRTMEKTILEGLEQRDPELSQEIKKRMFVFEDIILLEDRDLQNILREIDEMDLIYALKAVGDDVKEKVFRNVGEGYRERIKEELEYLGPIRLRQVEEAQERIVSYIRKLEENGEIVIARGDNDVLV